MTDNNKTLNLLTLYPPLEPFCRSVLKLDNLHTMYYEESGNPDGVPVVFLHGGPGGGSSAKSRQFFDPEHYRIIIFDQRGAGQSKPLGETKDNTTELLIEDMETLRRHLSIDQWHVFGGSWGSTLALCYAIKHSDRVLSLTLRGIFMMREKELDWFLHGMKSIFPEAWHAFVGHLDEHEQKDILGSYYKRLNSDDRDIYLPAAKAWSAYEMSCARLVPVTSEEIEHSEEADNLSYCIAKIEAHYFANNKFSDDNYIINNIDKIRHIPTVIVQGRYDVVCPIDTAYDLHRTFPEADFIIIPDAGHSSSEPGTLHELITATNKFRSIKG